MQLIDQWWHAGDLVGAYGIIADRAAELGVGVPAEAAFVERHRLVEQVTDDEEEQRRHQLGLLAVHLYAAGVHFHCYNAAAAWETGEPPWLHVDPAEHARLLALGDPPLLEAAYNDRGELPALARLPIDVSLMNPSEAHRRASTAFAAGDNAAALAYVEHAKQDGDHGLLAELLHIDILRRLNRRDEARARWTALAGDWLRGARRVWSSQWLKLAKLHGALKLPPDDPVLVRVRAMIETAPE